VALRLVWQVAQNVNVPVVGLGGIMTAADALEFMLAGAQAIQVGTANFVNPRACLDILAGLKDYLVENHLTDFSSLIGGLVTD
jgi:dihydroorotate dehydrogenase (NAD+) catalytic subunit